MSSMSEKSMLPSKFLSYLMTVSFSLLILSALFLLRFGHNSFVSRSVFKSILVNRTSINFKPNVTSEQIEPPSLSSVASPNHTRQAIRSQEVASQISNSSNKLASQISNSRNKLGALGQDRRKDCDPNEALLRVYMYDLPPEFHFGLLGWKGTANQIWPDLGNPTRIPPYPGGLTIQHSVEYWITLDLLSSNMPNVTRPCTAIRVQNSSQADIIFVPIFSSLSYNRDSKIHKKKGGPNRVLQGKLVQFLKGRDEWKRFGRKDHLIVAHHPNSLLVARKKLGSVMFVLSDFGRYPRKIANLEKDVIAPYKHVVRTLATSDSAPFKRRPILVYFQGGIYRKDGGAIRQELFYLLKDEKDVHFTFGNVRGNGINQAGRGMASSKFCLNIAGDTPSSNRLFDAIVSHCVPVIISDDIELPFEDVLDYSEFCIFVGSSYALQKGFLLNLLRGIEQDKWTKMWERLKQIVQHFEYQYPSRPGDAVDMIWQAVSRKISSKQFEVHRKNRHHRLQLIGKIS